MTSSQLCNTVRYGWRGKGGHSSQGVDPQDLSQTSLTGGGTKVGTYSDPSCPSTAPAPTAPPESPPPPQSPDAPPRPPGVCDSSHDVIVVGAGAGGAAAAAFIVADARGATTLVLSDGPDRSAAVSSAALDDTLYNRFGQLSQRAVPNVAGEQGSGWVQITGAGGNNAHNGGVHQMPSPFQMDTLLGMDGRALEAAAWLAVQPGLSSLAATPTSACSDRDPTNLTAYHLHGPLGCSPLHRYATCSDAAACLLEANVASSVAPSLAPLATGLRKGTMYSDLLKPAAAISTATALTIRHDTKGERVLWDGEVAHGVLLDSGEIACARCGIISAGGVWGTAELLMKSLGLTSLGGLWEHAVIPLFDTALFGDAPPCDSSLLRAGNLHTDSIGRAQAEYLICDSSPPRLLAAWVSCCFVRRISRHSL